MSTNVLLPQWGMNMEDGTLVRWLVKEGDTVEAGQPLVEVETAKINSELETPVSGVVAHIMAPEGSTVNVGTIVAVIAEPGETVSRPSIPQERRSGGVGRSARQRSGAGVPDAASRRMAQVTPVARRLARQHDVALEEVRGTGPSGRITEEDVRQAIEAGKTAVARPSVQIVPQARLLARQESIDLGQVEGTGPNGRIVVADVKRAILEQTREKRAISPQIGVREVVPLKGLRRTIADRDDAERPFHGPGNAHHRGRCHRVGTAKGGAGLPVAGPPHQAAGPGPGGQSSGLGAQRTPAPER